MNSVEIKKSQLIDKLVEHWLDGENLQRDLDGSHNSLMKGMLEYGFTGYWNMTDDELEKISRRLLRTNYEIVHYSHSNHDEKNFRSGVEIREIDEVRKEIDAIKGKMDYYESLKDRLESLERSQELSRQQREMRHTSVDERPQNWK